MIHFCKVETPRFKLKQKGAIHTVVFFGLFRAATERKTEIPFISKEPANIDAFSVAYEKFSAFECTYVCYLAPKI